MDNWTLGITLLVMGMLMCFSVLGLLAFLIRIINRLFPYNPTVNGVCSPALIEPSELSDVETVIPVNPEVPAPIVAAIVSAIACATERTTGWQVTDVRRVGSEMLAAPDVSSNWSRFGRVELLNVRHKCADREGSWRK